MSLEPKYRTVANTGLTTKQFNRIPCPNLRTGVRMGLLNPDAQGWVKDTEVRAFLEYIGIHKNSKVEDTLISTGKSAPTIKREGYIDITAFKDTFLDHGSSSGILNNPQGFLSARLKIFKSYANEQGRLYKNELALALNHFHQCPFHRKAFSGTHLISFEMAGMLALYGRRDEVRDEHYFSLEDIDDLWMNNRFPDGWLPQPKTFFSTGQALLKYAGMMWQRIRVGWFNTQPQYKPAPIEPVITPTQKQKEPEKEEEAA